VKATLALSAAAHVIFLAAVIGPAFQGRSLSGMEVINVNLVGGGGAPAPKPGAQLTPATPKEPEPAKDEQAKMSYKAAKKEKPKAAPAKSKAKPAASAKASDAKATKPAGTGTGVGTGTGPGPGGPGSGNITVDSDFRFAYYLEAIRERISYNWAPPALMGSPTEVAATVFFKIARDGTIDNAEVEKASNHEIFDRAALRAVKLADPLPPLPAGFKGKWLGVHFEFQHTPG
jgi:periplasmic protein TonB